MGTSTRKDEPVGSDSEMLRRYDNTGFYLIAICLNPACNHHRRMVTSLLIKRSETGAETTLGEVKTRLRCHKCGNRQIQLSPMFGGRSRDGR
jgi:hypothetical protein